MYLINYCEHLGERRSNYSCLPTSPLGCINYYVFSLFDFVNKKEKRKKWSHLLSTKFIKNGHRNLPVYPTELEMLFEIAKSVEVVIILRKTAVLP